jgi:hypothetical protein
MPLSLPQDKTQWASPVIGIGTSSFGLRAVSVARSRQEYIELVVEALLVILSNLDINKRLKHITPV